MSKSYGNSTHIYTLILLIFPDSYPSPFSISCPSFSIFLQYSSCSCSYHVLTMFLRHLFSTTILLLSLHNYYIILHHTTPHYYISTIVSYFSLRLIICLLLRHIYSVIFLYFLSSYLSFLVVHFTS